MSCVCRCRHACYLADVVRDFPVFQNMPMRIKDKLVDTPAENMPVRI